jgi:HEPN superfamily AbiU2-like protein
MNGSEPSHETFSKVLNRLTEFVVLGKTNLRIARGISRDVMTDPVIADAAPVFWGMTLTSHLDIAQLVAFKLFDTRNGTMTIEYLLDRAAECSDSFQKATPSDVAALIVESRSKIASIAVSLEPLRKKRNRILAHMDPTIISNPQHLAKVCAVTFADLDLIFKIAGEILNSLNVAYRDTGTWMELSGGDDYESIVQLIVDAKHAMVDRFETEFGETPNFARPKQKKSAW